MSSAKFEPADDVIYQTLQDEIVLLNMNDQRYFGLDDVGSDMWKLLVEHGDIEMVTDRICTEYEIDQVTVRRDLDALIASLITAGLLKAVDPATQAA